MKIIHWKVIQQGAPMKQKILLFETHKDDKTGLIAKSTHHWFDGKPGKPIGYRLKLIVSKKIEK
jgi:hypothetical protein